MASRGGEPLGSRVPERTAWCFCVLAVSGVCLGLASVPVRASLSRGSVGVSSGNRVLQSGALEMVDWSRLPLGTDEVALLLCCDSPFSIEIHLVVSKAKHAGSFAWTVPNLPFLSAHLSLRLNGDDLEQEWAVSAPFRILWRQEGPRYDVRNEEGDLWLTDRRAPRSCLADDEPPSVTGGSDSPCTPEGPNEGKHLSSPCCAGVLVKVRVTCLQQRPRGAIPGNGAPSDPPLRI